MPPSQNRREHPRWKLEKEVFCYIDGVRLDAHCDNISTGGLFIRTSYHTALPIGALVGLTFRMHKGAGSATFLFGRIVRRVSGRDGGVGLKWKKAVTVGPRDELAGFLKKIFRIESPEIREEPAGKGQTRSIFHFPPQGMSKLLPIRTGPAAAAPSEMPEPETSESPDVFGQPPVAAEPAPAVKKPVSSAASIDKEPSPPPIEAPPLRPEPRRIHQSTPTARAVVNPEQGMETVIVRPPPKPPSEEESPVKPPSGFEASAQLPHSKQPGAISQMIARQDSLAQVNLRAELVAHDVDVRARIIRLGAEGLIAECPFILIDRNSVITIRFEISSKGSSIPIEATCSLRESVEGRETGTLVLELRVTGVDEGGHPGVLSRYVKWLLFHSLAKA